MTAEHPPPDDVCRLSEQLEQFQQQLARIDRRLARLEAVQGRSAPQAKPARRPLDQRELLAAAAEAEIILPRNEPELVILAEAIDEPLASAPAGCAPTSPAPASPRLSALASLPAKQPTRDANAFDLGEQWEELVGGRWLTWAGALTLIVAVAFFVPWAWHELNLPDWSKVLMLHLLGLGLAVGAWVLHRRDLNIFAQGLAGVGIFTLYASAWAAQHLYKIYGPSGETITFIECAAITAAAIAAATSARSMAMILLGALGGYLTPIIASSGSENHVALFTYLAFLNVALIGSAVLRDWSFLKPLALAATVIMFALWRWGGYSEAALWSTQWLTTLHWGIFLFGATLPPLVWQRRSDWLDLAALSASSLWFVGATWLLFHRSEDQQLALVCWGMTLLHLLLFAATYHRVTHTDRMPRVHLALAAVFFILATPLQLEDSLSYLALAWSAQGVAVTLVGIWFRDRQLCATGLVLFALAALRLLAFDYQSPAELIGVLDRRFLMFLLSSLLMILGGALYPLLGRFVDAGGSPASTDNLPAAQAGDRRTARLHDGDTLAARHHEQELTGGMLMAAGNLLAMIGLTCQWDSRLVLLAWTLDVAAIWVMGFWLDRAAVRSYGLLLATVLVGGRMLFHGNHVASPFALVLNERFGTLLLVAAVYFAAAWAYRRSHSAGGQPADRPGEALHGEKMLDPLLAVLGNIVLVVAMSMEVSSWFDAAAAVNYQPFANMRMAEQATYSILWAVYSALAVVLGILLRWPVLRFVGLIGLAATLAKVFFVDLASLQLLPRVLALAVLGIVLLAVSLVYQKLRPLWSTSPEMPE